METAASKSVSVQAIIADIPYLLTQGLTLKAPITTAADDIHKYIFIIFQRK